MKSPSWAVLLIVTIGLTLPSPQAFAQLPSGAIDFNASYVSDIVMNFSGGISKGGSYLGMIDLSSTIHTDQAGLWNNGEFYFHLENTHGGTASETHIGDVQIMSNIENGNYTYLYQLWYRHKLEKITLIAGIHDLNSEFLVSEFAGEFVNSSFGIMPVVAMNVPVPIFPKATLGMILQLRPLDNLVFQAAIYDGDPLDLESDLNYSNFSINSSEGFLTIGEVAYSYENDNPFKGTYKIGAFHHSAEFASLEDPLESFQSNYGAYLIIDQFILPFNADGNKGLGVFLELGFAPKDRNINKFFWGAGINCISPFKHRDDMFGLAVASADIYNYSMIYNPGLLSNFETVIEFMYKTRLGNIIVLQPEIQYIINPGATKSYNNALVGLLRTYLTF